MQTPKLEKKKEEEMSILQPVEYHVLEQMDIPEGPLALQWE